MTHAKFLQDFPQIDDSAFIAPSADLMGKVIIEENASIWFQTVLRADIESIVIGPGSNIQDGTVIHLSRSHGTKVGSFVTVGHKALLHACTIDDEVLVGMGSIIMDGAMIGARSLIGAGALVTQGTEIPPGSLVLGSPAKVVRKLSMEEQHDLRSWAEHYVELIPEYQKKFPRLVAPDPNEIPA